MRRSYVEILAEWDGYDDDTGNLDLAVVIKTVDLLRVAPLDLREITTGFCKRTHLAYYWLSYSHHPYQPKNTLGQSAITRFIQRVVKGLFKVRNSDDGVFTNSQRSLQHSNSDSVVFNDRELLTITFEIRLVIGFKDLVCNSSNMLLLHQETRLILSSTPTNGAKHLIY